MITTGTFVLADMDCLFDTRLGTIALYSPETAIRVLRNPGYTKRLHDDFTELVNETSWSQEDYELTYQSRNVATLSYSKITTMVLGLKTMFNELYKELANNPEHLKISLVVNFYPYKLTTEEKEEHVLCLMEYMPEWVEISTAWIPTKSLSPGYMKTKFTHWVTYDFNKWTALHFSKDMTLEELRERQNPHLKIMTPMLLKGAEELVGFKKYTEECIEKHDIMKNPFLLLMFTFSDMFELILHPVSDFCCILQ